MTICASCQQFSDKDSLAEWRPHSFNLGSVRAKMAVTVIAVLFVVRAVVMTLARLCHYSYYLDCSHASYPVWRHNNEYLQYPSGSKVAENRKSSSKHDTIAGTRTFNGFTQY